ncbi:hypothetical protein KVR01_007567 [Diaporthe batatas]|uniref:uncharacterized protein n=1 Tax=Diaporthe batatas TaxID=748121 RepID=UPI001D03EB86|nr:uncharacterized protein KVR01_007567 [Diaporthe batatas]KAG8163089.1 hypothetical protein KVR01_007567 [Diaporthe batatas]
METSSSFQSATWPLSFRLKQPKPGEHDGDGHESKQQWWSYELYRGPRNRKPKVLYARSRAESEEIAEGFSQEQVLGFDMEWPSYDAANSNGGRLQDKIGVIAIACEDKIALFHLGAYAGRSPDDFIGPVLRAIIESPAIIKAGVNILAADFRRLKDHFYLRPQGAMELSHLHSLVTHGTSGEFNLCTTKLCALGEQVRVHLGLPLKKSSVRTSNWSQKKQLSREQKSYAASDAYAGLMLYHYLDHLRLSMEPQPPPPLYAERYRSIDLPGRGTALLLQLDIPQSRTNLKVIRAADFLEGRRDATYAAEIAPQSPDCQGSQRISSPAPPGQEIGNPTSRRGNSGHPARTSRKTKTPKKQPNSLLHKLKAHRDRIAKHRRLDKWKIIHNSALELIAKHRPENEMALMQLKGVGPQTVKKYGAAILNLVAIHVEQEKSPSEVDDSIGEIPSSDLDSDGAVSRVNGPGDQREAGRQSSPDSGTSGTRPVQQSLVGRGSGSHPIELGGSTDADSAEASSERALKRQHISTGPRHGLLKYFRVNKDARAENVSRKP